MSKENSQIQDLITHQTGRNRLLGIDHGERRVGLSLSDVTWSIASPYKVLDCKNKNQFFKDIQNIQKEFNIAACVLGIPINMDGSRGAQSQKVEEFARVLGEHTGIPVLFWDERWSTQAVEKMMIHADLSRSKRDKSRDALAAAYILQGILDHLRFCKS